MLGELHPRLLEGEWGAFELDLADLFAESRDPVTYADVITYPAVRQDIAVSVPEEVAAGELVAAAREAAGPELREIRVFDVYRGDQVGDGRKSVAFSVAYQARPDADRGGRNAPARRDRRRAREALRRRASLGGRPLAQEALERLQSGKGCERSAGQLRYASAQLRHRGHELLALTLDVATDVLRG